MTELSDDLKALLFPQGMEELIRGMHGQIHGDTITVVMPSVYGIRLYVLPPQAKGTIPEESSGIVYGSVQWTGSNWCVIWTNFRDELPFADTVYWFDGLDEALGYMRGIVGKHAAPTAGWTFTALQRMSALGSLYVTAAEYETWRRVQSALHDRSLTAVVLMRGAGQPVQTEEDGWMAALRRYAMHLGYFCRYQRNR